MVMNCSGSMVSFYTMISMMWVYRKLAITLQVGDVEVHRLGRVDVTLLVLSQCQVDGGAVVNHKAGAHLQTGCFDSLTTNQFDAWYDLLGMSYKCHTSNTNWILLQFCRKIDFIFVLTMIPQLTQLSMNRLCFISISSSLNSMRLSFWKFSWWLNKINQIPRTNVPWSVSWEVWYCLLWSLFSAEPP